MLRVAVGSKNPAKIEAVRAAFQLLGHAVEVTGLEVESGVAAQPFSDEDTIQGAVNRAKAVLAHKLPNGPFDYGVGLEGGVVESPFGLFIVNWGAVVDANGTVGIGGGHRLQLPERIAGRLREGEELGTAIDDLIGRRDIKKNEGTIGVLTGNLVTRQTMFRDVVVCAFAKFLRPELYSQDHNNR